MKGPIAHFRDLTSLGDNPQPWNHIVPRGEFPGTIELPAGYDVPGYGIAKQDMEIEGTTVIGDRELESIVQRFSGDMLIDADHLSHDQEHNTEAMGWGIGLRYMANRADGLELQTEWTHPGREKIIHKVYRKISPEFAGTVKYEDGTFKFYPIALTGAGLTNRPKLKALRPVSANRETNEQNKPDMKAALTLLCGLIGAPETANEQELTDKVSAFKSDIATSKNRAKQADDLEKEIKGLREESIASDLERFKDVIGDVDSAKLLLQSNREATVKLFSAQLAKKGTTNGNPDPLFQKNRSTAPDGKKFLEGEDDQKEAKRTSLVAMVKNREKCDFGTAWTIAKGESPELFE
jgi:phage I-like protein